MVSLYIKNGSIVTSYGIIERAGVLIEEGRIVGVVKGNGLFQADEVIDATSKLILPGAIDAHAHIDDPTFEGREDFNTGTRSAVTGGVTSLVEMPAWSPVLERHAAESKIERGRKMSFIDFRLHAGNVREVLSYEEVRSLRELGIVSYKIFTCDPHFCADYAIYSNLKLRDVIFMFHAENNDILKGFKEEADRKALKSAKFYHLVRPPIAELEAVNRIIFMAEATGARVHFVHISVGDSVRLIKEAKERGVRVSVEVCPHHLYFTEKDMERLGPYLKVNPPVRSDNDRKALIDYLNSDVIDVVGSDHYPTFKQERERGWEDMDKVRPGLPGVGTLYQSMINLMLENVLRPEVLVRTLSENPAKLFALYPKKGGIRIGADADLVIVDPKGSVKVTPETFAIHSGWTPFEGFVFKGRIEKVLLRGEIIVEDYELKVTKPAGQYLALQGMIG